LQRIETNPVFCGEVVKRGLLSEPFRLLDLGARGGTPSQWLVFGDQLEVIPIDPDEREPGITAVVGRTRELRPFFRREYWPSDSLYRSEELFEGTATRDAHEVKRIETVETQPLIHLVASELLARIDFAKLDVEQAEMDVLVNSGPLLEAVLGLEVEVHFPKRPAESACFSEVDTYLRGHGFELYDLDVFRYTRPQWPAPTLYDVRDESGRPVPAPTVEGQTLTGDALYIRRDRPTEGDRAIKLACIFELHRLRDCAVALLERAADLVPDDVSALLKQPYDSVHAEDGRPWGPNYHIFEELWRLRPYGYRDPTLSVPGDATRKEESGAREAPGARRLRAIGRLFRDVSQSSSRRDE
jgi:Methyltransferase FkbM domain